jgi:threonine synthase
VNTLPSIVSCAGCGFQAPADDPYPFRCPNAGRGDDTDHVMTVALDAAHMRWPGGREPNPFVRYRTLFHSYHLAAAHSMSDAEYVGLVERLDRAIAAVDGHGCTETSYGRSEALSAGFAPGGGLWVKDETGNVSGSHKARHLMGLLLHLEVLERIGLVPVAGGPPDLAIASCGNAALAAAVVARAADRRLQVFIPTVADPKVVARLRRLEAELTICPREEGVTGDPTYHRLRQAVRQGALPFTCQGSDNGLTIEGGKTLGYEMVSVLAEERHLLDRVFVQVGGGALASAVIQAFQDAVRLGVLARLPRIHAVQTRAVQPLARAYDGVADRIVDRIVQEHGQRPAPPDGARERADLILASAASPLVEEELRDAVTHRSEFMWPWEQEPRSVAGGIIDDETYDWAVVVRGMIMTGGYPVAVSEETLLEANGLARSATGINVDPTGSAGLAGLLELKRKQEVAAEERVAVLFTGVQR